MVEVLVYYYSSVITLPETNIAPENRPSQKERNFPTTIFGVLY